MRPPRSGCNPRGFPDHPSWRVVGSPLRTGASFGAGRDGRGLAPGPFTPCRCPPLRSPGGRCGRSGRVVAGGGTASRRPSTERVLPWGDRRRAPAITGSWRLDCGRDAADRAAMVAAPAGAGPPPQPDEHACGHCSWPSAGAVRGAPGCDAPRPGRPAPAEPVRSAVMAGFLQQWFMGAAIYLALVGGGLTAAFLLTVVLRGIRLI